MSYKAWVYIWFVLAAGAAIVIYSSITVDWISLDWFTFAVFTAFATISQFYEFEGPGRQSYYPNFVFYFGGALLLDSFQFLLLIIIPNSIEWVAKRLTNSQFLKSWYLQPFNISTYIIAGFIARNLLNLVDNNTPLLHSPTRVLIVSLLAIIFILINHLLIGLALKLARGISLRDSKVLRALSIIPDFIMACLGYVVAVLWAIDPWLILPALSLLVLMYESLKVPKLKQEAETDAKTGLLNAGYLNKTMSTEFERAKRFNRPLALIVADLDLLRNVNNNYGHLAGDIVLGGIGKLIREHTREYQISGRFGGEEFVIVLPETSLREARDFAEKLRKSIEQAEFEVTTSPTPIKVTMSMGVSFYPIDANNLTELLHQADLAVYHAKANGRNKVICATDIPSIPTEVTEAKPEDEFTLLNEDEIDSKQSEVMLALRKVQKSAQAQPGTVGAFMLLELSHLKMIEGWSDFETKNVLLKNITERLENCLRYEDRVIYLQSEKFIIFIEGLTNRQKIIRVADRIISELQMPFILDGREMLLTGNIGIVLYEDVNYVRANLLSEAEVALSQAKSKGLGFYAVYDLRLNEKILQRLALAAELRMAIERNELRLYYQPKIFLKNGHLEGVEALVRWKHPTRGLVTPAEFIPLAEETGLINALGKWVMKEACLQAKRMNSALYNHPSLLMSINISIRQFQQHDLVEQVEQILSETGVNPFNIQFEISEGIVIEEMEDVVEKLKKLKGLGVRLALDDFGTGYSNLRYLKYLPIDTLKIDKSLIMGFDRDLEIISFVQSVIGLGHSMHLMVVAEGVENLDELVNLQNVGCDLGQGYYFAKPMAEEDLNNLLASEKLKAQLVTMNGKVTTGSLS